MFRPLIPAHNPWSIAANEPLSLEATLQCGQCFGWRRVAAAGLGEAWLGVVQQWPLLLRQTEPLAHSLQYRCLADSDEGLPAAICHYFQLATPMLPLWSQWTAADSRAKVWDRRGSGGQAGNVLM
jgi:hypothetical protein